MNSVELEAKNLISIFYQTFVPEMERYKYLELVTTDPISATDFYTKLVKAHAEIRTDIAKKARYFISKKVSKLNSECKNELPEINVVKNLSDNTASMYWETVHQVYMLLESEQPDKDEAVINTIAGELKKLYDDRELSTQQESEKRAKESVSNAKKVNNLSKKINELDIPNPSDLLDKASSINPEMAALVKGMINNGSFDMNSLDAHGLIKKALSENSQHASLFSTIFDAYTSLNGDFSSESILSAMRNIMSKSNIDFEKPEYTILIEKVYQDILYVYEKKNEKKRKKLNARIDEIFEKYQNLFAKETISSIELFGCVWKIIDNEEKKNYIDNMAKDEISAQILKNMVRKYVPSEILSRVPVNVCTLIDMIFTGDFSNLSSMIDVAKGWLTSASEQKEEPKLSEEQMNELEQFYDQMMATDTTSKKKSSGK